MLSHVGPLAVHHYRPGCAFFTTVLRREECVCVCVCVCVFCIVPCMRALHSMSSESSDHVCSSLQTHRKQEARTCVSIPPAN